MERKRGECETESLMGRERGVRERWRERERERERQSETEMCGGLCEPLFLSGQI